jgi:hypothetical protein
MVLPMGSGDARGRFLETGPKLFCPGIAIAAIEVSLLLGLLAVVLSGRLVLMAGTLVGLTALGVVRVRRQSDGAVAFLFNLLVFGSETFLTVTSRQAPGGGDDSAAAGVREPRRPLGPGPATATARLDRPGSCRPSGRGS